MRRLETAQPWIMGEIMRRGRHDGEIKGLHQVAISGLKARRLSQREGSGEIVIVDSQREI